MKKILFSLIVLAFAGNISAQTNANVKKPSLALKISAFDFTIDNSLLLDYFTPPFKRNGWLGFLYRVSLFIWIFFIIFRICLSILCIFESILSNLCEHIEKHNARFGEHIS